MPKPAILCVDDEIVVLESLEIELRRAFADSYLYEFAENANEALEIIEELVGEKINILVIVSDWLMPGMKGDELLLQIHQKYPSIIKIMLTGQADKKAVERAKQQASLHTCLYKPWNTHELITAINSGIQKI